MPRILRLDGTHQSVLLATSLADSVAATALIPLEETRSEDLAEAARNGGLWLVRGDPFPRVITATAFVEHAWDLLLEQEMAVLFDGGPPRAELVEGQAPVDLLVPVQGWEGGTTFYFHSDAPFFAEVPVVEKVEHTFRILRGKLETAARLAVRRRLASGQRCGVLVNEFGGVRLVPEGEVVDDIRAVYSDRFRFIVDGVEDLDVAAGIMKEYAEAFAHATATGWELERPIHNAFAHATNRGRLLSLLPFSSPVAVLSAAASSGAHADDPALVDPTNAPIPAVIDLDHVSDAQPLGRGKYLASELDQNVRLADALVRRLAGTPRPETVAPVAVVHAELVVEDEPVDQVHASLPVLRTSTFVKPRGRLMRIDSPSKSIVAVLAIQDEVFSVLRGAVPAEYEPRIQTTIDELGDLDGIFGLCRGAFGHVLAEEGSPMRAVESLSSSISYAHLLDGVDSLDEAAGRLDEEAERMLLLAKEGWVLSQPIAGFWLRLKQG